MTTYGNLIVEGVSIEEIVRYLADPTDGHTHDGTDSAYVGIVRSTANNLLDVDVSGDGEWFSAGDIDIVIDEDNGETTKAFTVRHNGIAGPSLFQVRESGDVDVDVGDLDVVAGVIKIGGDQVLKAPITGWGIPTGSTQLASGTRMTRKPTTGRVLPGPISPRLATETCLKFER